MSDFCTLAEVRTAMELEDDETNRDALLTLLIPAASAAIAADARRLFYPVEDTAYTFTYRGGGFLDLAPYDLRTPTTVTVAGVEITRDVDYYCDPEPAEDGVYTSLELERSFDPIDCPGRDGRAKVIVTGDWGFAAVPDVVNRAAIVTVQSWASKGDNTMAQVAGVDDLRARSIVASRYGGWAIPPAARRLYAPLKRVAAG